MPLQDINAYLSEQRQKQDLAFLDHVKTTGIDPEQFLTPDGKGYLIPLGNPNPAFANQPANPEISSSPFKRGMEQVGGDLASAASTLTGAVGAEDWSQYFRTKADSMQQSVDANPSSVPTFEDIHSMGDLATYIYERTAENVPMLATLLIPGSVVGLGARAVGAGAKVARGAAWTTAALTDAGLQIGESASDTIAGGNNPVDMRVIGTGLGKAVLDMLPVFAIAKATGIAPVLEKSFIAQLAQKGYLKRVAGAFPTIAAVEVPTEVAQEAMDIALQRTMQQKEGDLTDEEWSRLQNAAAGAAAVSLGISPLAGMGRPRVANAVPPDTPKPPQFEIDQIPKPETKPPVGLLSGAPGRPAGTDFFVNPEGIAGSDFSVFDSAGFYNPATGAPKITGDELRRALIESGSKLKYDPKTDAIVNTQYSTTWKTVNPTWIGTEDGGAQLGEDAKITRAVVDGKPAWDVWNVFGSKLGTYASLPEAMQRGEEYTSWRTPKVSINAEGTSEVTSPASGERVAAEIARQSQNPTPTDAIMIKLDEAHTKANRQPDLWEVPEHEIQSVAMLDQGFQRLLEMRGEILDNKSFYKGDGSLTKTGQKQLDTIESKIASFADKAGFPNPLTKEHAIQKGSVEDQLQAIAAQDHIRRSAPKYKNLTSAEANLHDRLMEKEIVEGLTDNEMNRLLDLQDKIKGDNTPLYRKPTPEELEEIRADMNDVEKIMAAEMTRVKKQNRGINASLDEDGNYMFSRAGNVIAFPEFKITEESDGGVIVEANKKTVGLIRFNEGEGGFLAALANQPENLKGSSMERMLSAGSESAGSVMENNQAPGRAWEIKSFKTLPEAVAAVRKHAVEKIFASPSDNTFDKLRGQEKSLSRQQIHEAVIGIYKNLNIKPVVRIAHISEFPKGKGRDFAARSAGFIDFDKAGMVTLVADNIFSKAQAQQVFVHEVLLHYGIRSFMNPQELTTTLQQVLKYRAKEIFENKRARGELENMDSSYGDEVLNLRDAEEFLANKMEEAWIRWQAGDKNWMQDSIWEKPGEPTFVQKMINFFRRVFARIGWSTRPWNDHEIASMLKDIAMFMSGKLTGREAVGVDAHWKTSAMRSAIGPAALSEAIPNMNSFSQVWGAKWATLFLTPLQIAEKFKVPGAARYLEQVQLWWARKRDLTTESVAIAEDWQKMPKREMSNMSQALFDIDRKSEDLGRRLTDEELKSIVKEHGLGETATKMIQRIDETFQTILQKLQYGLEFNAIAEHTRDTKQAAELHELWAKGDQTAFYNRSKETLGNLEVGGRLVQISNEMAQLRNRNYFPHMRFGKYAIYIRAKEDLTFKGREYKGPRNGRDGQVVYFETFEKFHDRDSRAKELLQEFPSRIYEAGYGLVSDAEFTFLGMPPSLYEALGSRLNLSQEQSERLKELYFTRSPGRSFLKHLTKRKGTEGFSQDALRTYATYMMNASNHIARVEYHREMGAALTELRDAGKKMGDVAGVIRDYFGKHFDYIMNPAGDWASIRGIGFLWYLGFNVKSALVNLTQVPMVAYPYLAANYGDGRAVGALSKAYGTVVRLMRGQSVLDDAAQVDINRAFREGVIDQAQATELAAIAESPVLQRLLPTNTGQKLISELGYYGSWAFRHAETFNRRVVFLAARDLAIQKGLRGEDVFLAAKKAVQTSMFEYSKWNRPKYSQGKKSVFFLFWNYMQHLSYLSFGGEGRGAALRIWTMLLLTAGLQGLPFAEDILDAADLGSTKAKELLGLKDPKTDLRLQLREIARSFSDNPDLIMHGLSRYYGLGPLHLLELLGVPVPGTDISGSLSAGRVLPGIDPLTKSSLDPDKDFGQAIVETLGPIGGIGYNFWKVLTSRDPDTWKVWERAMPTAMKNASQAARRWNRGAETFRGGGAVATFSPHDFEQRAELVAGALGFGTPRVSARYEERSLQEEMKQYWLSRRALVMENYAYAVISHDQEALADARKALGKFNSDAPAPQLKISSDSIHASLKQRLHLADLREQALPSQDAFVPLYRRVRESFPQNEVPSSPQQGLE